MTLHVIPRATPQVSASIDRVEYLAVTAKGAPIRSFEDRKAAVEWLTKPKDGRTRIEQYPGATVQEVVHYEPTSRTVWRERTLKVVGRVDG